MYDRNDLGCSLFNSMFTEWAKSTQSNTCCSVEFSKIQVHKIGRTRARTHTRTQIYSIEFNSNCFSESWDDLISFKGNQMNWKSIGSVLLLVVRAWCDDTLAHPFHMSHSLAHIAKIYIHFRCMCHMLWLDGRKNRKKQKKTTHSYVSIHRCKLYDVAAYVRSLVSISRFYTFKIGQSQEDRRWCRVCETDETCVHVFKLSNFHIHATHTLARTRFTAMDWCVPLRLRKIQIKNESYFQAAGFYFWKRFFSLLLHESMWDSFDGQWVNVKI